MRRHNSDRFLSLKTLAVFTHFYSKPLKIMIFPHVFYVPLHSLLSVLLQRCE